MGSSANTSDEALSAIAKALAHPARIKIIRLLLSKTSCIGGEITSELGLAQSTVSEHLRILKAAGVIVGEIEHPRVCYTLRPGSMLALADLLEHISDKTQAAEANGGLCCPLENRFEHEE